jgi:hypothetical protein
MIQYLVIAARNHPELYNYLRRQFVGDHTVQVLLDRRYEERRRVGDSRKPDRRRGDRRAARAKENGLNYHGFAVIRQSVGLQWRPPWWGGGTITDTSSEAERTAGLVQVGQDRDARTAINGWVTEGRRLLAVMPKFLHEHEHLAARADAAERKCARCEEEIRLLRSENEHFRRERRQAVETLKALTKQLIESGAETSAARS